MTPPAKIIVCPLCHAHWVEIKRERGSCIGCGAGLNEMLHAYTRRFQDLEKRVAHLEQENTQLWHKLNPESMGR